MVKKFLDQKVRTRNRNFQARPDRTATGTPAKSRSERDSNIGERKQRDCYQGKAEGKCSKKDVCIFKHDASKRGKGKTSVKPIALPLPHRNRRRGTGEKVFRKVELSEEVVLLVESSRSRVKSVSTRLARIHRVTFGILPSASSTKHTKVAVTARQVLFHVQRRANSHGTERQEVGLCISGH